MTDFARSLSEAQASAVLEGTNLFLKACPGAGKTRSVAARAAKLVHEGKSLALLSYTRVGAAEIAETITRDYGVPLTDQNFVGTLHSFLFRYVLRPFGHLITGAADALVIDNDEVESRAPAGLRARDFEYGVDGSLRRARGRLSRPDEVIEMAEVRASAARAGFVNFTDAISISLQVLRMYPQVAQALALRFDEMLIDEAQDTNELLLACIRELHRAGLRSLVLIGDYDQAIYEFNGSNPDACERLAAEVGLETRELRENFRSSQLICNVTAAIRGASEPDLAVGPFKDVTFPPTLLTYDRGSERVLIDRFRRLIADSGLAISSAAALVRRSDFAERLAGSTRPYLPDSYKPLLAAARGQSLTMDDYKSVEDLILRRTYSGSRRPMGLDRTLIRSRAVRLIADLPPLAGDLAQWAADSVAALDAVARELSPMTTSRLPPMTPPGSWRGLDAAVFSAPEPTDVEVATIHQVKGRSIDAVMLVAQVPEQNFHTPNAHVWSSAVGRARAEMNEELRLGYVALTRARQIAVVAVPSSTSHQVVDRWFRAGFVPDRDH